MDVDVNFNDMRAVQAAFVMMRQQMTEFQQQLDDSKMTIERLTNENAQLLNAQSVANDEIKRLRDECQSLATKKPVASTSSVKRRSDAEVPGPTSGGKRPKNAKPSGVSAPNNGVPNETVSNNEIGGGNWTIVTTKGQRTAERRAGERRVTPIQLQALDIAAIKGLGVALAGKVAPGEMVLHRLGDEDSSRITFGNEHAKGIVIEHLKNAKVQFNSYNNSDTRKKAFIVRGLMSDGDEEAIKMVRDAVLATEITEPFVVSKFETPYQRHNPSTNRLPLYRIVVPSAVDDKLLLEMRSIGYSRVRVEKMKKSSVVQCHRCQRLHHTTGQCYFSYRCVQCTTQHEHGQCPRATNDALPIGCVNCFDAKLDFTNHTANDLKNCNFYNKLLNDQLQRQQRRQQTQQNQQRTKQGPRGVDSSAFPAMNAGSRMNDKVSADSIKTNSNTVRPGNQDSYAGVLRGGRVGGMSTDQLAELVSTTVKTVLASLLNGV